MSILNVEHLTHGFGDRAIFNDVSFRLLKGEHIGLVGANGEGKSTFFNIVTGKLMRVRLNGRRMYVSAIWTSILSFLRVCPSATC